MAILEPLRRVSEAVNRVAIVLCVACILLMLGISFTAFLYKLATGSTMSWTYSLARLFLPWIGFLSMTISLRYGEHVAMTLLVRSLPRVLLKAAAVACLVVIALFALMLVWYGWDFFLNATQMYMVSDNIQISNRFTAIVVPLSGLIILLHLVHGFDLLEHFIDDQSLIDELIETTDLDSPTPHRDAETPS